MTTGSDTPVTKAANATGQFLVIDSGEHMVGGIAPGDG